MLPQFDLDEAVDAGAQADTRGVLQDELHTGAMGWGYAGSTGRTANAAGLPSFTGLAEGFGKIG